MNAIEELLKKNRDKNIALYGLGTETERFLGKYGSGLTVIGLLDGFREDGDIYGYPIISLESAIEQGVSLIIVVARPGSCKAIVKRIGDVCRDKSISLYDVRGRDLLASNTVAYDFNNINGGSKQQLLDRINEAEVVSFDLFDTLLMRKVESYTDVFELLEKQLIAQKIFIPDFAKLRLLAEKECSKDYAPTLIEIYDYVLRCVGGSFITAYELAKMEWEIDRALIVPRYEVCDIFKGIPGKGKKVVITTDCYYSKELIEELLSAFELEGYDELLVSSDIGTSKTLKLFEHLCGLNNGRGKGILHIGDDETADIACAKRYGIETYRLYSGAELFDILGGLGTEKKVSSLSDRVKIGLFISKLFNNPFVFEGDDRRLSVADASAIGYLFCGPMIADFSTWLRKRILQEKIPQILFCARDGFLVGRLYRMIDKESKSYYFLASRTAAIRAGVENEDDIEYIDSMKYFGSEEDNLKVRFGIDSKNAAEKENRNNMILKRSEILRKNYRTYINKLGIDNESTALFDFVAKGTTQMYLQKLFPQHIKGFYFLQLEPEFMSDKGLDIEPFYSDEEKNNSAIFDNYYILETMLTSPYPATEEFDEKGNPLYSKETRSEKDIDCFKRAQEGIVTYFKDYISVLAEQEWEQNKELDEVLLSLINCVRIDDEDFMSLTVEDSFFGRMTAISDVIG